MKVKLYNETPLHRDNFIKLVRDSFYNELLFHRVIKNFMIQGGDPESKGASLRKRLGAGGPNYEIPAEIKDSLFHKKGALAAARTGDNVNPERKSSGSQFYIVQGKVWTDELLQQYVEKLKSQAILAENTRLFKLRDSDLKRLQSEGKKDSIPFVINAIQKEVENNVNTSQCSINEDKRKIYTTIGGTPPLDGAYTVFGEVVDGLEIIDSIANVTTVTGDRPVENIKMWIEVIE